MDNSKKETARPHVPYSLEDDFELNDVPMHLVSEKLKEFEPQHIVDMLQELTNEKRNKILAALDKTTREELEPLLAYGEETAAGLMSPRFACMQQGTRIQEAINQLRDGIKNESILVYVTDKNQHLMGMLSFRDLIFAASTDPVEKHMTSLTGLVPPEMDQENVANLFAELDVPELPVVNGQGKILGVISFDDIADVMEQEATEDIHKFAAVEAFKKPYLKISFLSGLRKRGAWLLLLFVCGLSTVSIIQYFAVVIEKAVLLAAFLPLVISSGGNAGSQATSLVIRALALGDVKLKDWFKVLFRETRTGLVLGSILAAVGVIRIVFFPLGGDSFQHSLFDFAAAISLSLVCVVTLGAVTGAMLPFLLQKVGFDPATASAPLVSTILDLTGIAVFFTIGSQLLSV